MKKVITLIVLSRFFISCSYAQVAAQSGQLNFTHFTTQKAKITKEVESLTGKEFKTHPEYGIVPFNAPCKDCFELLQKRDEKHRYFVKNGTNGHEFYSQTAYSNLNYNDANGRLLTIDYRLGPTAQKGVFSASRQPVPVTVNLRDKYVSIMNAGKEIQVNRNISLFIKKADGALVSMGEANWTDYTAGDNGVVVHNIYAGIDLEMRLGEGNVESFYRINKPLNLNGGSLVIRDNMQLPEGFVYDYSYSEKKEGKYEGALCINSGWGTRYFIIGNPAAIDENSSDNSRVIGLRYVIGDNNNYDLYVPVSWMNDPKRNYPIVIDPFVTSTDSLPQASITGSGYNATCFTGGCTYDLNVIVPPACVVSDILYSFNYQALGTCNIDQGGWDLKYGACRSAINTCHISLPGSCILQNLSLYDSVKTCLPATQCAADTLPFTLTFYRCVQTGAGCGFSCINATTPWDMTVNGNTSTLSNISIVAGPDTICQGESASLSAMADSGIAPFAYTWYPGGQTGQTISVSPASTTTYSVTASMCSGADSAQAVATVTVNPLAGGTAPVISISPVDSSAIYTIQAGDSVNFKVTVTGDTNIFVYLTDSSTLVNGGYNASFSAPDSAKTTVTRTFRYISSCSDAAASPYHVTFKGSNGKSSVCSSASDTTLSVTINVLSPSANLLDSTPNVITPNGDGRNDSLSLYHLATQSISCWSEFHIEIFNRWGESQFESSDFNFHWDGTNKSGDKVKDGVYYYIITAEYLGKAITKKGTVNVLL